MNGETRVSGAVVVSQLGGPEVLEWVERDPGEVGPDEVRVRHTAVGLNFIDVYHRTGLYPHELPFTPGVEGAGIVEAVGDSPHAYKPTTEPSALRECFLQVGSVPPPSVEAFLRGEKSCVRSKRFPRFLYRHLASLAPRSCTPEIQRKANTIVTYTAYT